LKLLIKEVKEENKFELKMAKIMLQIILYNNIIIVK